MSSAAPSAGSVGPGSDRPGSDRPGFDGPASRVAPRTILRPGDVISQAQWPTEGTVTSVHVVRIGGAGMSAVARLALEAGLAVSGSDSQDGQFIGPLREAGAVIGIGFDAALLGDRVDVVVVSTAVRADNPEVLEARRRGIPVVHRAAALAGLLRSEEHTSELQSRGHLVCRLLLDKKNTHTIRTGLQRQSYI